MLKSAFFFTSLFFTTITFAETSLNATNVLGKYEMNGVVDLKVTVLPNNKVEAIQVGIFYDTKCNGKYTFNQSENLMEADLNCDGERLKQKIEFANTTLEDLKNGTQVHVLLEYKSEKYDLDFDIIKIQ